MLNGEQETVVGITNKMDKVSSHHITPHPSFLSSSGFLQNVLTPARSQRPQLLTPAQHQMNGSTTASPSELSRTGSDISLNGGIGRLRKDTM
jgi:hypothetical protein